MDTRLADREDPKLPAIDVNSIGMLIAIDRSPSKKFAANQVIHILEYLEHGLIGHKLIIEIFI